MDNKKVLTGVDIFKFFAAVGVLAIHTNLLLFDILGKIGVPFFIIISSYFFFSHYLVVNNDRERHECLKKFVTRISSLFLAWEVLYVPLIIYNSKQFIITNKGANYIFLRWVFNFFYPVPPAVNGWSPSWYLIAMTMGMPIFVFLLKFFKGNLTSIGSISVFIEIYYVLADEFGFLTRLSNFGIYGFPRVIIYIFLGLLLAKYVHRIKSRPVYFYLIISVIFLVAFVLENILVKKISGNNNINEVILTAPTSFGVSCLSVVWQPRISNTVYIRKFSTFLYCIQWWFLNIMWRASISSFKPLIWFIFVFGMSLLTFIIYNWLFKKTNWKLLKCMV